MLTESQVLPLYPFSYLFNMAIFNTSLVPIYFLLFVVYTLCFQGVSGKLQQFEQATKADGSLSLLVVGDWGRKGNYNQSRVAFQMGKIGQELNINFVISDGDNFYDDGLTGVSDPAFKQSFRDIYTASSLQKRWYNILGNHDYRGNVEAQLDPILRSIDRRWFCMRSYLVETDVADFFFVDTAPFVNKYFTDPGDNTYDWSGVLPRDNYLSELLKDVDSALKNSSATWKIVVGHHPIRSIGEHGDTTELVDQLLPILKANNVDMYINGHDHCLQHISSTTSSLQYLTSGGGSKAWRNNTGDLNREGVKFYYDGQGFMSLKITKVEAQLKFYDVNGIGIYYLNLNK